MTVGNDFGDLWSAICHVTERYLKINQSYFTSPRNGICTLLAIVFLSANLSFQIISSL